MAIYVGAGTTVENNVIVDCQQGIAVGLEEASAVRNVRVVNNTVFKSSGNAFAIRGTAEADSSVVVSNNVFLAEGDAGFGYRIPDAPGGMVVRANHDHAPLGRAGLTHGTLIVR